MTTFVIDTDHITHAANASAYTLSESAAIWIFQENVRVIADNSGGTGINGGGFDGNLVRIEGSVDATEFLLTNFGSNNAIEVSATGRLGQINASTINLYPGTGNRLTNHGVINAEEIVIGRDGVVLNDGEINLRSAISGSGAELLSNNGTINGALFEGTQAVVGFRRVINDGIIGGDVFGAITDTQVINNGSISGRVELRDGNDLYDGSGGDVLGKVSGGKGDDTLTGGAGDDQIDGEQDDDLLIGRGGADTLQGGNGNDTLNGGVGDDVINGQAGDDQISGGNGDDQITGGDGGDTVTGGDGKDSLLGNDGDDSLFGDDDNDIIYGGDGDDRINGGRGSDDLRGVAGSDNILGGAGDDTLRGGSGKDTLVGGPGDDLVRGGGAGDLFEFRVGSDVDVIDGFADDTDEISLTTFNFGSVNQALSFAQQVGDNVEFDFGGGDILIVNNTTIAALHDDIIV